MGQTRASLYRNQFASEMSTPIIMKRSIVQSVAVAVITEDAKTTLPKRWMDDKMPSPHND
jgi:hypothetical protein